MDEEAGATNGEATATPIDRVAAADYVADLTAELAKLARQHGLDTLGFILDMARLEAQNTARRLNGRN